MPKVKEPLFGAYFHLRHQQYTFTLRSFYYYASDFWWIHVWLHLCSIWLFFRFSDQISGYANEGLKNIILP